MSSNFRETANLVISLREKIGAGTIESGSEVFVFTDNSTAKATMYKGSSRSPLLHQMVLDLRKMEIVGDIIVHFVLISGKRMIRQGTDGLSRGDFSSGVMAGEKFLKFLPLHQSALETSRFRGKTGPRGGSPRLVSKQRRETIEDRKTKELVLLGVSRPGWILDLVHSPCFSKNCS